jgi:hypothetical protein
MLALNLSQEQVEVAVNLAHSPGQLHSVFELDRDFGLLVSQPPEVGQEGSLHYN